jgi:hypothetical protein
MVSYGCQQPNIAMLYTLLMAIKCKLVNDLGRFHQSSAGLMVP